MRQQLWRIISAVSAVCLLAAALVAGIRGGCTELIECVSGLVPMKCHWTFIAVTYLAGGGVIVSLTNSFCTSKEGRRIASLAVLIIVLASLLITTGAGIGVCSNSAMPCNTTVWIVRALGAVAAVLSIIQIIKADPQKADLPKKRL